MLALLLLVTFTQSEADRLVQQLRLLPTPMRATARSDGRVDPVELQRRDVYRQLRQLGDDALPALARGLADPDVRLRKNVALAVAALAGTWWDRSAPRMNIRPILGELIAALHDDDTSVRAWSAQAIGEIGPDAAPAVPALIVLLANPDEGSSQQRLHRASRHRSRSPRRVTRVTQGTGRPERRCSTIRPKSYRTHSSTVGRVGCFVASAWRAEPSEKRRTGFRAPTTWATKLPEERQERIVPKGKLGAVLSDSDRFVVATYRLNARRC